MSGFAGKAATCHAALALACCAVAPVATIAAQRSSGAAVTRDTIVVRIADLRRITTPNGIEALEEVEIDGTRQWVSIRARDRANPVLLMIHGGPGNATMPVSWAYQTPWEDFFTVVQWDQRGVGKNALSADHAALAPTLTVERSVADAEAVVAHLRAAWAGTGSS